MKKKNYINLIMAMVLAIVLVGCGGGSGVKDSDKDGVGDNADAFPDDANETTDSDKDGVGDNADAFPDDANETTDSDKDGVGDNADAFPDDALKTTIATLKLPGQAPLTGDAAVDSAVIRIMEAATRKPAAGGNSVTQSSVDRGANQVDVAVVHDVDGSAFEVINTVGRKVPPHIVRNAKKVTVLEAPGWQDGAALKKDFPDGSGTLYVNAYTDIDPPRHYVKDGDRLTGEITQFSSSPGNRGTLNGVPGKFYEGRNKYSYHNASADFGIHIVDNLRGDFYFVPDDKSALNEDPTADTNYLSIGYWLYTPKDIMQEKKYDMGVFAAGADPFGTGDFKDLNSSVTYHGDAVGLHVNNAGATPVVNAFTADVMLTARFYHLNSPLASVTGEVSNFVVGEEKSMITLMLGSASIDADKNGNAVNGGFFSGFTSTTGDQLTGMWGGQFFGKNRNSEPASAAGTFGAARRDYVESYTGAFGVYAEPQ